MTNFYILIIASLSLAAMILLWPWRRDQRLSGIVMVTLVIVASLAGYRYCGGSQQVQEYYADAAQQELVQEELKKYKSPQELIAALKSRVEAKQNDPKGWFLLARLYSANNDAPSAIAALQKANALKPHDTSIQMELVQVDFFSHDRHFSKMSYDLLQDIVQREPENATALDFFGGAEFQRGHYEQAITHWRKLLPRLKPGSEELGQVERSIREAQSKMQPERKIHVTIDVPRALQKRIKPNDTLFVFAKAVKGPPMPLVVSRQRVTKFPITITLTNENAMLPEDFVLLAFDDVMVGARISHSEEISQNPDDIVAISKQISFEKTSQVKVELNHFKPLSVE
jgi:cytochrome c-type biogenesis protein CcmH